MRKEKSKILHICSARNHSFSFQDVFHCEILLLSVGRVTCFEFTVSGHSSIYLTKSFSNKFAIAFQKGVLNVINFVGSKTNNSISSYQNRKQLLTRGLKKIKNITNANFQLYWYFKLIKNTTLHNEHVGTETFYTLVKYLLVSHIV